MSGDELCRRLSVAANLTLSAPRYSAVKKSRFTAEQRRAQRNPNVTSRVGLAVFLIASFVLWSQSLAAASPPLPPYERDRFVDFESEEERPLFDPFDDGDASSVKNDQSEAPLIETQIDDSETEISRNALASGWPLWARPLLVQPNRTLARSGGFECDHRGADAAPLANCVWCLMRSSQKVGIVSLVE